MFKNIILLLLIIAIIKYSIDKPIVITPKKLDKIVIDYEIVNEPVRYTIVTYIEGNRRITTTMLYNEFKILIEKQ